MKRSRACHTLPVSVVRCVDVFFDQHGAIWIVRSRPDAQRVHAGPEPIHYNRPHTLAVAPLLLYAFPHCREARREAAEMPLGGVAEIWGAELCC